MKMEDDYKEPAPNFFYFVCYVLETYGWYLVGFAVILGFAYTKFKSHIDNYLQHRSDQAYAAKYHKDPDLAVARLAAQQKLIDNLQMKYNKDAEKYATKMEEKENKKRAEWLENNKSTPSGSRLGNGKSEDKPKSWKPEYNPLMGSSTRNYRPPKKSCCGKGGCG